MATSDGNPALCPHCKSEAVGFIEATGIQSDKVYFKCGFNDLHRDHRPPACYNGQLQREEARRTAGLDYLQRRMATLGDDDDRMAHELASVTNVLCGGQPLGDT